MSTDSPNEKTRRDDLSSPLTAALSESERRYRTLFGAMEEGFCVVEMAFDASGKPVDYDFLEFNAAFERMTGITAEAALAGRSARELYPTLEEFWFETYGRVAATGEPVRFESRAEAMGKWFEVHAFRIGGAGSREVGILFKDISQRRLDDLERERLLFEAREREAFLALITDRLPVRVGYLDREYRYRFVNGAYERAFGLRPGEGVGRSVAELAGEEAFRIAKPFLDRALAGDVHTQEFDVPYSFGDRRVEVQYVADRDEAGEVRGVVIHVLDVTERFAASEALRKSEERYRTLFDSLEEGFCVFEMIFDEAGRPVDYRFREVNEAFTAQTGLRKEDVLGGKTMREMVPAHEQAWFDRYGRVARTGEPLTIEDRAEALGRWYSIHAFRIGGEGSNEVGALFKDVSLERSAQAAIEEERALQDRTLETAQVATFSWDLPTDRVYPNPLMARFFGAEDYAEGVPAAGFFSAIHPDDRARRDGAIGRSLATGGAYEVQYRVRGTDERERWVLSRGRTTLDVDGKPTRLSAVVLDITERKRGEEERERLLGELETERERLEALFKMSPSAIAVIRGDDLRFEFANDAYLQIVGRMSVVGKTLLEALPELEGQGFSDLLRGVLATGEPYHAREVPVSLQLGVNRPVETIFVNLLYQAMREVDGAISGVFVHAIDVTDQVLARKAIAEREELFRTVFEQAPDDAILVMDVDRTLTAWNSAAERITGWTAAEAVGQLADIIFTQEDRAKGAPTAEMAGAARLGKAEDERWHVRKDGSRFWGSGTLNALHNADGGVRGYLKIFRDATERYEEAQTLAFLSLLTEAVIDERDAERILETVERMLGQYLGASRVTYGEFAADEETFVVRNEWGPDVASVLGSHTLSMFGAKAVETLRAGRTHVVRDASKELDTTLLATARAIEALSNIMVPVIKDGRLAALCVVHDRVAREWTNDEIGLVQQVADRMSAEIERARAEAALRRSEERFRQLVDLSPSTVWFGEPDGGLSYISQDFYDATGLSPETALPSGWTSVIHPEDASKVIEEWAVARRDEALYDTEFRVRHRDGEYRWVSARALPLRDGDGRVTGWLGSNSDIHERKTAEETLQARVDERTEQLQAAVREAEGFNYSISHDLRTPLRAMVATSSILLEEAGPELDEDHRGLLVRQSENAKRLGRLIDELLRLSRLARVPVVRERLDITRKAQAVAHELDESGGLNGCRIDVQEGMAAEGDAGLVRTVLQNLVGNACKFSPAGGTVRIGQEGEVFSVSDEGVGFDMQFAPKIFLPFERLVSESEFPGTGIGLANVKRIVERHDGRVWVESAPGEGTKFYFTLGDPASGR